MAVIIAAAGGGNWTTGSTWVGGVAPTAADDAQFNATSGNVTVNTSAVCRSADFSGAGVSNYTGTLTHTAGVTWVIGDATAGLSNIALKMVSTMTYTKGNDTTCIISLQSSSATQQTITTGGKNFPAFFFQGIGASFIFSDNFTATGLLLQNRSTVDYNGKTFSVLSYSSTTANARTINLNSASITCTATTGNVWDFTTTTNLTFSSTGSTIICSGNGNRSFVGGGQTFNNVTNSGTGTLTITGANTFANLSHTANNLSLGANQTVTTLLTSTGTAINTGRAAIFSNTAATPRTITAGAVSLSNVNFTDITAAGAGSPFSGTNLGDSGGNTNITFSTKTVYWVGDSGSMYADAASHWASITGGSPALANTPLVQDAAIFDDNSFTIDGETVTNDGSLPSMNFSAIDQDATLSTGSTNAYGQDYVFSSRLTFSSAGFWQTVYRGDVDVTTNGMAMNPAFINITRGGTLNLLDDWNGTGAVQNATAGVVDAGFNTNGHNLTADEFTVQASGTGTVTLGASVVTLTGTGTVWSIPAGATLSAGTSAIVISDTSATAKTFIGGGKTYNNLQITTGGTGTVDFTGSNTFASMTNTGGSTKTIRFTAGTTTTLTGTNFFSGAASNLITIGSITAASHTLSKSSGVVSSDYLSISRSTATGGAAWYAGANSTDGSNNSGWIFAAAPSASSRMLMGIGN